MKEKIRIMYRALIIIVAVFCIILFNLKTTSKHEVKIGVVDSSCSKDYIYKIEKSLTEDIRPNASHSDMVIDIITSEYKDAKIYLANVLSGEETGKLEDIILALDWLKNNNVELICMSLATTKDDNNLKAKIEELKSDGIIIVAACINYSEKVCYPANYIEVISVANCKNSNATLSITDKDIKSYLRSFKWKDCGTSALTAYITGRIANYMSEGTTSYEEIMKKIQNL